MAANNHYDFLADRKTTTSERDEGPLVRQFSFNNWIKSMLIQLATPHKWADGLHFVFFSLI